MDQQLENKAGTGDWKGQRRAPSGAKQKAEMEPLTVTWDFRDEEVEYESGFRAGEGEDPFSDCYIECVIRGEFSDPILDEDILLKSFDYLRRGTEHELSRQVLAASSFLERSWGYNIAEERRELSAQSTGENPDVEHSRYASGGKLPPGEKPRVDGPVSKQLPEAAKPTSRENTGYTVPENICPQRGCAKKFKNKSSLNKHLRTHGPRDHVCAECGRAFVEKSKLNRHFLIHTGERPFQCTYEGCGKRFSLDFNLRTHVRIHTKEKRFACTVRGCNKKFVQSGNLKVHILTHVKTTKEQ